MREHLYAEFMYPNAGTDYDKEKVREVGLEVGRKYEVRDIDMGNWYTKVWLEGYSRAFNSVHFEFYEDGKEIDIYNSPKYNIWLREGF